jgi:hypothetical protein
MESTYINRDCYSALGDMNIWNHHDIHGVLLTTNRNVLWHTTTLSLCDALSQETWMLYRLILFLTLSVCLNFHAVESSGAL